MKITPEFRIKLLTLLELQKGVLTKDDLWTIISPSSDVDFYRQIKKLIRDQLIRKALRGFYVGQNFSASAFVMATRPESYLSLER